MFTKFSFIPSCCLPEKKAASLQPKTDNLAFRQDTFRDGPPFATYHHLKRINLKGWSSRRKQVADLVEQLNVEMRLEREAGISHFAQYLACLNFLTHCDSDGPAPQVGHENEAAICLDHDIVAGERLDGIRPESRARGEHSDRIANQAQRYAIGDCAARHSYDPGGRRPDWLSPTVRIMRGSLPKDVREPGSAQRAACARVDCRQIESKLRVARAVDHPPDALNRR